jgi:hypothetical protein
MMLLVADLLLIGILLANLRVIAGALFAPGFLGDPSSVPPAVVDARLGIPAAILAFGLPTILAALALFRARRPGRAPWTWSQLGAAWVVLAFVEIPLASPDLTAMVLVIGFVPAVLIGLQQSYLRRLAGEPREDARWSPLRRTLILVTCAVVIAWLFGYLVVGAQSIFHLWQEPHPEFFPNLP